MPEQELPELSKGVSLQENVENTAGKTSRENKEPIHRKVIKVVREKGFGGAIKHALKSPEQRRAEEDMQLEKARRELRLERLHQLELESARSDREYLSNASTDQEDDDRSARRIRERLEQEQIEKARKAKALQQETTEISAIQQEAYLREPLDITADDIREGGGLTEEKTRQLLMQVDNAVVTPAIIEQARKMNILRRNSAEPVNDLRRRMHRSLERSLSTIQQTDSLPELATAIDSGTMPLDALTTEQFLKQYMFVYAIRENADRDIINNLALPKGNVIRPRNPSSASEFVDIGLTVQQRKENRTITPYYQIRKDYIAENTSLPVSSANERSSEILAYMQQKTKDSYATGRIINENTGTIRI